MTCHKWIHRNCLSLSNICHKRLVTMVIVTVWML